MIYILIVAVVVGVGIYLQNTDSAEVKATKALGEKIDKNTQMLTEVLTSLGNVTTALGKIKDPPIDQSELRAADIKRALTAAKEELLNRVDTVVSQGDHAMKKIGTLETLAHKTQIDVTKMVDAPPPLPQKPQVTVQRLFHYFPYGLAPRKKPRNNGAQSIETKPDQAPAK